MTVPAMVYVVQSEMYLLTTVQIMIPQWSSLEMVWALLIRTGTRTLFSYANAILDFLVLIAHLVSTIIY